MQKDIIERTLRLTNIPLRVVAIHRKQKHKFIGQTGSGWMFYCSVIDDEIAINGTAPAIHDSYLKVKEVPS